MLKFSGSKKQHTRPVLAALSIIIVLAVLGAAVREVFASGSLAPETIDTGTFFPHHAITVDAAGTPYVYNNGTLYKRTTSGWVQQYSTTPVAGYYPSLLVDPSNTLHAFYHQSGSGNNYRLFHAECDLSLPGGTGCPAAEEITTRPGENPFAPQYGNAIHNSAVLDSTGNLHLVYGYYYGYWGLFHTVRTGGVWSTPARVHPGTQNEGYMHIDDVTLKLDPDGQKLHVAFNNRSDFQVPFGVYYGQKTPTGSWMVEPVLQDGAALQKLAMAMNGSTPLIVYPFRRPDGLYDLRLAARLSNGTWTHETLYAGATGGIQSIDAEVLDGTLHVIFDHGSGSSDDFRPVYLTKQLPNGAPASQRIFDSGFNETAFVSMAAAPSGIHISFNHNQDALKYLGLSQANQIPVTVDDAYSTDEDVVLTVPASGVLVNDADPENDALNAILMNGPIHGTLVLNADGSFTYTPEANFHGTDSFTYKANDGALDSNAATVTITVAPVNDAPLADDRSVTTDEDTPVDITLTGSDVDGEPLSFNVADLPSHGILSGTAPNLTYTPNLNFFGSDSFTFQACDAGGLCGFATVQVEVIQVNHPPTVDDGGPYSVIEGGSIQVTATGHDPEDGSLTYEWDLDNDGVFEMPGQTVIFPASGLDGPSTATIAVRVTDNGNLSATAQTTVEVLNAAPVVETITAPIDPIQVNTAINTSASFTDPGTLDSHTAIWDWGDTGTSDGTVNETDGSGTVTGTHTYTSAGVYTVKVTVTDDDGGSDEEFFRYVVVYDPNGGFVTGGGWINSPEGAYVPDPTLTGKANFGFVSKYQRGATVPTGQTEFQFHVADLNFKSTSYEWLVIAGTRAQYKGTGTINGTGEYGFLLTAIDGSPDKFRIKIWDKGTDEIVYDNMLGATDDSDPTTSLEGGSIVVHRR